MRPQFILCVVVTFISFVSCYLPYQAYCGPDVNPTLPHISFPPSKHEGISFSSKPQSSASSFKLLHSQLITRHGDRTIIDRGTCWKKDTGSYDCDLTTTAVPNNDLTLTSEPDPQSIFRLSFLDGYNYMPGNCSAGQLSSKGYNQLIQNGDIVRQAYIEDSSFLSKTLDTSQIYLRTDNELRTLQSCESLILGLYPETDQGGKVEILDINTMDYDLDDMQVNTNLCPVVNDVYDEATADADFQHAKTTYLDPLFKNLSSIVGYTVTPSNFYHVWDCSVVHLCWGEELPTGIDSSMFDQMNEAITLVAEYFYSYPTRQYGAQTGIGFLLKEILTAMNTAVQSAESGKTISPKFLVYSGHDTTLLPMLVAYDVSNHEWPSYASYIVIELYQNASSSSTPKEADLFVRFLYNNSPLVIPGCDEDIGDGLCAYSTFKEITETLIPPDDYETFCASTSSSPLSQVQHKNRRLKEEGHRGRGGVERGERRLNKREVSTDAQFEERLKNIQMAKSFTIMKRTA